jgi:large subunit ribosomal protein L23
MPFLDIFKKKKEREKVKPEEKPIKKPGKKLKVVKKAEEKRPPEATRPKAKKIGEGWRVLKTPQVTEKATDLVSQNQYVFKVWPRANKVETKKAIEALYGVDVVSVKMIKVPRKRRRLGRISGWRKGYKKAIVRIKEGQKIEILPR